jgi:hypothetical protein
VSADLPGEHGQSVQDLKARRYQHVEKLTVAGVFKGQQSARTVFTLYVMSEAANDNKLRAFRRGYVMPGSGIPKIVAKKTGLGLSTVHRAMDWLHEQGFIELRELTGGTYRYVNSVKILSYDEDSEASRLATAGTHARSEVKPRKPRSAPGAAAEEPAAEPAEEPTISHGGKSNCHDGKSFSHGGKYNSSDLHSSDSTLNSEQARRGGEHSFGEDEAASRPSRSGSGSSRKPAAQQEHDNVFWLGKSKDGEPYFTKTEKRPGRIKTDLGQVELTREQAGKFFGLCKADKVAWREYKRELFRQFRPGASSGPASGAAGDDSAERVTADDYNECEELMKLASELATYPSWRGNSVRQFLRACLRRQDTPARVIEQLQHQIEIQAA